MLRVRVLLRPENGKNKFLSMFKINQSSIPVPFNGRVQMSSSNSTLVTHRLQYIDSAYQFSLNVKVDSSICGSALTKKCELESVVSITVNGMSIYQIPLSCSIPSEGFIIYCYIYCKCQVVYSY